MAEAAVPESVPVPHPWCRWCRCHHRHYPLSCPVLPLRQMAAAPVLPWRFCYFAHSAFSEEPVGHPPDDRPWMAVALLLQEQAFRQDGSN